MFCFFVGDDEFKKTKKKIVGTPNLGGANHWEEETGGGGGGGELRSEVDEH